MKYILIIPLFFLISCGGDSEPLKCDRVYIKMFIENRTVESYWDDRYDHCATEIKNQYSNINGTFIKTIIEFSEEYPDGQWYYFYMFFLDENGIITKIYDNYGGENEY